MRIQWITQVGFWPPFQGDGARLWGMISYFRANGAKVHVTHLHDRTQASVDYSRMAALVDGLSIYEPSDSDLGRRVDGTMDDWCPDGLVELAEKDCAQFRTEIAVAQLAFLSRVLPRLVARGAKAVLDADNAFAGRAQAWKAMGVPYNWFSATELEERKALSRADLILAIQSSEATQFQRISPRSEILLVPHGMPTKYLSFDDVPKAIFVGADNEENNRGLGEFLREAWPAVLLHFPRSELLIVGTIGRLIERGIPGVSILGIVPDLERVYRRAWVAINPCPIGTGLKIKSVEALCHGRCLLTTRYGAQGIETAKGVFVREIGEFPEVLVRLFGSLRLARRLGNAALKGARARFTPDVAYKSLKDRMEALLRSDLSQQRRLS